MYDENNTALLQALKEGSIDAFEQIYLMWRKPVFTLLYRITRSEEDAEDITQDVFAYLWNTHERVDPGKSLKAYVFLIAKRTAYRLLYRNNLKNTSHSNVSVGYESEEVNSHDLLVAEEIRMLTEYAIQKMPARQKEVYSLHYYENLSSADIAERLNISQENVRKNLQHAKKHLKEIIAFVLTVFLT